jgi:hypothetical protein
MFKMTFITVTGLTLLLLVVNVCLAVALVHANGNQEDLIKITETGWQVGFSVLLGLLGGKAL